MELGLQIIRAIQTISNPALDVVFQVFTMFGEPLFMILIFAMLYWNFDREQGEALAFSMLLSLLCNSTLKVLVNAPRPIGQPGIRSLRVETATGSSFPSGHSQGAAAFYPALALILNRKIWRWICAVLTLLVGFSRLYLGVHYPRDVVAGLVLGFLLSLLARALFHRVKNRLLLYCMTLLAFIPFIGIGDHDFYRTMGCMLGFIAACWFEKRYVRFSTAVSRRARILRWSLGLLLLGALSLVLKPLLPDSSPFVLLRYFLLIFTGLGLYPWLFNHWKLLGK